MYWRQWRSCPGQFSHDTDVWHVVSECMHYYAKVLSSRVEISAVAVANFSARVGEKEDQESEDEQSGIFVSWRLITLAKHSVDVSNVVSHRLGKRGNQKPRAALN